MVREDNWDGKTRSGDNWRRTDIGIDFPFEQVEKDDKEMFKYATILFTLSTLPLLNVVIFAAGMASWKSNCRHSLGRNHLSGSRIWLNLTWWRLYPSSGMLLSSDNVIYTHEIYLVNLFMGVQHAYPTVWTSSPSGCHKVRPFPPTVDEHLLISSCSGHGYSEA